MPPNPVYNGTQSCTFGTSPQVVREAIKKQKVVEVKSCSVDLVTESDKAVEKLLIDGLTKAFPTHK